MRETTSGFDQANDSSGATPAVAGKGASVAVLIQRRSGGAAATSEAGEAPEAIDAFVASTRGGGSRLSGGVLQKMNSAFAQDFGGVGIHADATSAEACRAMGAQAFTVGSDVYFDQGKFDPGSREGQQLLGHELTHVVQQGGGRAAGAQARLAVGASDDPLEKEADAMGDKAAAGEAAAGHEGAAPGADGAAADGAAKPKVVAKGQTEGTPVTADPNTLRMTPADVGFGVRDYSIVGSVPGLVQSHIAQDVAVSGNTNWKWIWRSRWIVYDANDQVVDKVDNFKHPDYTLTQSTIKKGVPSDGGGNQWTVRFEAMETGKPFGGSAGDFPWDQSRFHVYASPIANPAFTAAAERGSQIVASDTFTPAEDGASYAMQLSGTSSRSDNGSETVTNSMKVSGERESSFGFNIEGVTGGLKDKIGFEAQRSIAKSTGYEVSSSKTESRTFTQPNLKKGKTYTFTVYPKFMVLTGSANVISQNMGIVSGTTPATGSIRIWTGYEFVAQ